MRTYATILITLLFIHLKSQNNVSLTFSGKGILQEITGLDKTIKAGSKVNLAISIKEDKAFLKEQFKPLFDSYLLAIHNVDDEENKEHLKVFGIQETDIDILRKTYFSKLYHINKICHFFDDIKQLNLGFTESDLITSDDLLFKDLYSFTLSGMSTYTLSQGGTATYTNVPVDKILDYELRFTKPESRVVTEIYSSIFQNYPKDADTKKAIRNKELLKKQLDILQPLAVKFNKPEKGKEVSCDSIAKLFKNISEAGYYTNLIDYFKAQKEWVKLWLWHTGGIPELNPFAIKNLAAKQDDKALLKAQAELAGNRKRIQYYDSVMAQFVIRSGKEDLVFKFGDSIAVTEKRNKLLEAQVQALATKVTPAILTETVSEKDILLYEGKLCIGTHKDDIIVNDFRHHNAENKFSSFYKLPEHYNERSEITIVAENQTIPIKIKISDKLIEETTIVNEALSPSLDAILELSDITQKSVSECAFISPTMSLIEEYNYFNDVLELPGVFTAYQSKAVKPVRSTFVNTPVKIDTNRTSFIRSYKLTTTKDTANFNFRVNKLYRFWPAAGFVYSNAQDPEVGINDDGSLSTTYFNGMHLAAGIKIHFFKTEIMDPDFLISCKRHPSFDYRKLYGFVGVDLKSPAKQFYLGGGIDLWSGLSLTAGSHLIRKDQQKYNGGRIDSKEYLDWKNLYFGVNMDITLAVKLVQFIFK